ncbi:MAG: helix-turn-helix transcriptional regulator [Psychrobium sp.]|nr:helix-turn-helix transcriptional regulator [Psychrobium sp.]
MSNTNNEDTIGWRIRFARKAARLTQTELARLVGLSQQQIGNIENGGGDSFKMVEIADAIGESVYFLKTGERNSEFKVVNAEKSDTFTMSEIELALPKAMNDTMTAAYKILLSKGKSGVDGLKDKDLILELLTTALTAELTGDYLTASFTKGLRSNKE